MFGIVYSIRDQAGYGIAKYIREVTNVVSRRVLRSVESYFIKDLNSYLAGFKEDVIFFSFLDEVLPEVDAYIVLSRHSASSGIRSLTTHHTGNPTSRAEAGGEPYSLSISNPPIAWLFLGSLHEKSLVRGLKDFSVTYEATHHGPTNLIKPITFIEIGSTPTEWKNVRAQELVGDVVIESIRAYYGGKANSCIPTVGFGGTHYPENFTLRALKQNECFGHIIPRYALKELRSSEDRLKYIINLSIKKSSLKTSRVVLSKKVGSIVKKAVMEISDELGLEVVKG